MTHPVMPAKRFDLNLPAPMAHGLHLWSPMSQDVLLLSQDQGRQVEMAPGWYRIRMQASTRRGEWISTALEVRYRNGERVRVPLMAPTPDGRIDDVVLLRHELAEISLFPSEDPLEFSMGGVQCQFLPLPRRVFAMLARFQRANGRWDVRASAAAGLSLLRHCVMGRPRAGLHALSYRFQESRRARARSRTYADWVARYATPQSADLQEFARQGRLIAVDGPLISLLVPTYQTPVRWLRKCLDSVIAQGYPHWELCIADDASPDPEIESVLEEYAARDTRIRFTIRAQNGHISEASNTALSMARGQYVGLLDHDDELAPHALLRMVQRLKQQPALRLVYSDEDKIDASGTRFDPYFKPEWNPDLLLSQNYLCHFTVIDADLVREVGGFRLGFEGSQDHDLFLRCTRCLESVEISHVAEILYHWRAIPGSTALERGAKDYAADAGARAVRDHLELTGGGRVESLLHGHYRVRWQVPAAAPKVALIIPTRDRVELLRMCVESIIQRTAYPNFEIIIVDNQSTSTDALDYLSIIRNDPRVRVIPYDADFNYSAINNFAVNSCDADLVALVNNDIEVITPDWLEEMISQALRPGIGAVGAMLYYPDDTIQHAGVVLGVWGVANHFYAGQPKGCPGHGGRARVAQNLSAVTAACLVIQRSRFLEVGGLDEANLAVAFNDVDFCLRLLDAGYRNVWTPFAELYHHESASRGIEDTEAKRTRFASEVAYMTHRWAEILRHDPAYNPNLSLESNNCELAFPPREWGARNATVVIEGDVV